MPDIDLSIVVPLYNEEESVSLLYNSINDVVKNLNRSYEIIFVDDGSSDKTFELAKAIHEKDPNLKVIKFRKNYGQTPAMQAGFDHANGGIIVSRMVIYRMIPRTFPSSWKRLKKGTT